MTHYFKFKWSQSKLKVCGGRANEIVEEETLGDVLSSPFSHVIRLRRLANWKKDWMKVSIEFRLDGFNPVHRNIYLAQPVPDDK